MPAERAVDLDAANRRAQNASRGRCRDVGRAEARRRRVARSTKRIVTAPPVATKTTVGQPLAGIGARGIVKTMRADSM